MTGKFTVETSLALLEEVLTIPAKQAWGIEG